MSRGFYIIVAVDNLNGIGLNGQMPWHLKGEIQHFKRVTSQTADPSKQNMVIMGRTTWESLPEQFRPLKNRKNVVLTRNPDYRLEGAELAGSLEEALQLADDGIENIFVIGGQNVYEQAIESDDLLGVFLTRIEHEFDVDSYFPEVPEELSHVESLGRETEDDMEYEFFLYSRV